MTTYQIHVREVGRAVRSMLVNVEADSPEEADDLFAEFGEDAGEVVEREVVDSTFDLEFDEVTSIVEAPEEGA